MGRTHYWLSVRRIEELEEGTDRHAMRNGYVSITPLRLDLTDEAALASANGESTLAAPRAATRVATRA